MPFVSLLAVSIAVTGCFGVAALGLTVCWLFLHLRLARVFMRKREFNDR